MNVDRVRETLAKLEATYTPSPPPIKRKPKAAGRKKVRKAQRVARRLNRVR